MTSPRTLVFDVANMHVGAHFLYTLGIKQSPWVAIKCDSKPEIDRPKKNGEGTSAGNYMMIGFPKLEA